MLFFKLQNTCKQSKSRIAIVLGILKGPTKSSHPKRQSELFALQKVHFDFYACELFAVPKKYAKQPFKVLKKYSGVCLHILDKI